MKAKRLLIVVYDSVLNSVFESLVFDPAKKRISIERFARVDILSFESDCKAAEERVKLLSAPGISIIIRRKIPFIGKASLFLQAPALAKNISDGWYHSIVARGPLAGYLVKMALRWFMWTSHSSTQMFVTVQARGLAAEEARLAFDLNRPRSFFRKTFFYLKMNVLNAIEREVYSARQWPIPMIITTVSSALRDYLIDKFASSPGAVVVDNFDSIPMVQKTLVGEWRRDLRDLLRIPSDATVYGYSGSCKQWQCALETVEYIVQKIEEDPRVYGIILSTDLVEFQALIARVSSNQQHFIVRYVPPSEVLKWLSVCDYGILLRYEDIVNWVSRPTKALEYLAVGLSIIHNGTVKWLIDYDAQRGVSGAEITLQPKQISPS